MMGLETIRRMNAEAVEVAEEEGKMPFVAICDGDTGVFSSPLFGDYTPAGWKQIDEFFVDSSGLGAEDEPALTRKQLLRKVKEGLGYGIGDRGQFQLFIRVFEKE